MKNKRNMDQFLYAAAAQAQANAVAAQYYANASAAHAINQGGAPNGAVLLSPGAIVMTQAPAQMLSLPASNTWSGHHGHHQGNSMPPAPPPPTYSQHDNRDSEYDDRDRRHRRRSRSRSRSRSRDRHRSRRQRSRSRSRSRRHRSRSLDGRRRERSPDRWRHDKHRSDSSEDEPEWMREEGDTIMIRGLPQHITEQHVQDNIMSHGIKAKDIRLIRKKDTGASRGFAFVEFATMQEARTWIVGQQGWLNLDGSRVSMQYSVPRDQKAYEQSKTLSDWICAKCGVQNFKRRDACFKCGGPRTEFDSANDNDEVSSHPTNTVLLSGLDALTTEDAVLNTLGPLTKLPLKNVKIGRDAPTGMSRGVCYVEMNSVVDAMFLHNQLIASPPCIDGRVVEVSYHKPATTPGLTSSHGGQYPAQHNTAANSALAAAQWTNKGGQTRDKWTEEELLKMAEYSANLYAKTDEERRYYTDYYKKFYAEGGDTSAAEVALSSNGAKVDKRPVQQQEESSTVIVNGVEYKKYPAPDTSTYSYDETSGYYYDPVSTLYYDANSQYYYNSKDTKFYYWDGKHETFLPAPDQGKADSKQDDKKSSKDKLKSAKKIQKDMEKWTKKMNQKQSRAAEMQRDDAGAPAAGQRDRAAAEDVAFNVLQRKDEPAAVSGSGLAGLAGYGSDEEEADKANSSGGMAIAEMKLTDWTSLACLLCQRQFKSRDQLTKHNTMSDLHTSNLKTWRAQYSDNDPAAGEIQYRDRAKERRSKFGDDDKPPPNRFKEKFMKAIDKSSSGGSDLASAPKVAESNIGNKMLQKMGWKDGEGLGKSKQGRTDIILAQQRTQGSGLGTQQSSGNPNDSYKENARKTLWSRYNNA